LQFTRLRLTGFKSFVDPTELRIEPGLTGVVGPNGCGKSNLVEALRWVMGENSARSMRGSGMDDVIFAGTDRRPARNLAEVSLVVENPDRVLPGAFDDEDRLEITRRIERDQGSSYRINGRDVRAKDVQLLFADAATGAHSPAMVSQGRVGALISAKPRDRRAILEEAAGISGLHSRRREAEQKLKATEANLLRLQDSLSRLESQAASLKRQAKQAERYRQISDRIRQAEGCLLYQEWRMVSAQSEGYEATIRKADQEVASLNLQLSALEAAHEKLAALLPELRQTEAHCAARVQRLSQAADQLRHEDQRRADALETIARQIEQINRDEEREGESRHDARQALDRLQQERQNLIAGLENQQKSQAEAKARLIETDQQNRLAEQAHDAINQQMIEARGRRSSLGSDLATLMRRLDRGQADVLENQKAIDLLSADHEDQADIARLEADLAQQIENVEQRNKALEDATRRTAAAHELMDQKRAALSEISSAMAHITGEIAALDKRLKDKAPGPTAALATKISVEPGYEQALGAALGDDLGAAHDDQEKPLRPEDADRIWRHLPAYADTPALPPAAQAINQWVKAPPVLSRRLAQIGLVPSRAELDRLAPQLRPGQRLVTPDGAMMRWDGLYSSARAPSAAAVLLQQKNRFAALKIEEAAHEKRREAAQMDYRTAQAAVDEARNDELDQRRIGHEAEARLRDLRKQLSEKELAASKRASRLAGLEESRKTLEQDLRAALSRKESLEGTLAALPDPADLDRLVEGKKTELETARREASAARSAFETQKREAENRQHRLLAIDSEITAWTSRLKRAEDQLADLDKRRQSALFEQQKLSIPDQDSAAKHQALADELKKAQEARRGAADEVAQAETAFTEKDKTLTAAQTALFDVRESRARMESSFEAARERRAALARLCGESFQCPPPDLLHTLAVGSPEDLPDIESLQGNLKDLKADRDRMGPVNLRAEEELADITAQLNHIETERRDLEAAIGRLRHAIGSLNREGRDRLLTAFNAVNGHFTSLFQTLFGGGHAQLELVESDDPLDAGLEIMASPPGKRLQNLSLLSGGEQALTALSLIFAVFITNPSPICVLDEVDAPLDEANVERLCTLLDDMISRTRTRFLIVTHNEVTMARMHRLFGVTMAERGLSQLVSVDLERAEQMVAAE
jgi:chromosome segregation protein